MQQEIIQHLLDINSHFYETFGGVFAATRRRIQPGIRSLLPRLPDAGSWLDLGCGSGSLAAEWAGSRQSEYTGMDFSTTLLAAARAAAPGVHFLQGDLCKPAWLKSLPRSQYQGILCFAVLHHIPGADLRLRLLQQVRSLLPEGGWFVHSVWQFQNSPRLVERVLPWERAGLSADDLEPGDTLLDWRAAQPGAPSQTGLRYVHRFSRAELDELAEKAGFTVQESFESDGKGGRLGLYQIWRAG